MKGQNMELPQPALDPVCYLEIALDPITEMGAGRAGMKRIIPIVGGTVLAIASGGVLNLVQTGKRFFQISWLNLTRAM